MKDTELFIHQEYIMTTETTVFKVNSLREVVAIGPNFHFEHPVISDTA